jgi:hypothetical protein
MLLGSLARPCVRAAPVPELGVKVYRHISLLRWRPDATAEQRHRVLEELGRLPGLIPQIRAYSFGEDVGGADGHWDLAVVADFDDRAGYLVYASHPEHQRVIAETIAPIRADRASLQYEAGP